MPRVKEIAFGLTLAVFAASWIAPRWPLEQAMHSSLTVVGLTWLWWHDRRWPVRPLHFVLICAFIVAHCVGARWLYSYVPYDAWLQVAVGWSPSEAFGWHRNHFDRFIHLMYGVCFAPAVWHWLRQRWPERPEFWGHQPLRSNILFQRSHPCNPGGRDQVGNDGRRHNASLDRLNDILRLSGGLEWRDQNRWRTDPAVEVGDTTSRPACRGWDHKPQPLFVSGRLL